MECTLNVPTQDADRLRRLTPIPKATIHRPIIVLQMLLLLLVLLLGVAVVTQNHHARNLLPVPVWIADPRAHRVTTLFTTPIRV
jgi:hypothetical protein